MSKTEDLLQNTTMSWVVETHSNTIIDFNVCHAYSNLDLDQAERLPHKSAPLKESEAF